MEEDDVLNSRAFYVPTFNINKVDVSRPPGTGEEFLQQVIHEAKVNSYVVLPSTFIQKWRKDHIKNSALEMYSQKYLVKRDIQDCIIADFSQIRLTVSNYKLKYSSNAIWLQSKPKLPEDKRSWLRFLFGTPEVTGSVSEEDCCKPLLKLLLSMSQPTIWKLLKYFLSWMEDDKVDILKSAPWIYGLLACLELPIDADVTHVLREIARYFLGFLETIDNVCSEQLYSSNVIVILIARYFKQFDLIESYRMKV